MVGRRIIALAADLETAQPWLDRSYGQKLVTA